MESERLSRIKINDGQFGGRPCIRGMRIRVTDVLELLGTAQKQKAPSCLYSDSGLWVVRVSRKSAPLQSRF